MKIQRFYGKLLRVSTKRTRLPNGYVVDLEIVKHPGAVLIVPFLSRDKIIFLRQYRPVVNCYLYELPAGTLERGERLSACARREIIEETGFAANKLTKLGEIFPVPGYSTEKITLFKAEGLQKTKKASEPDEIITTHILSKSQVQRLFRTGKIKDSKTIAGLAFCRWL